MGFLPLPTVDVSNKSNELIDCRLMMMSCPAQVSQALTFKAHDSLSMIDEADLAWKPAWCCPQFPLVRVVLQSGVQHQHGGNTSDLWS